MPLTRIAASAGALSHEVRAQRRFVTEPLLRMTGISKSFPGVQALERCRLEVAARRDPRAPRRERRRQVDASQDPLRRAAAGCRHDRVRRRDGRLSIPHAAQKLGIVTIYQEFTLAPNMTIAENVFIGREPGSRRVRQLARMAAETRALTTPHRPRRRADDAGARLSVAEQQMVEIARALSMRSRLIVMDEPTSALSLGRGGEALQHRPRPEGRGP